MFYSFPQYRNHKHIVEFRKDPIPNLIRGRVHWRGKRKSNLMNEIRQSFEGFTPTRRNKNLLWNIYYNLHPSDFRVRSWKKNKKRKQYM